MPGWPAFRCPERNIAFGPCHCLWLGLSDDLSAHPLPTGHRDSQVAQIDASSGLTSSHLPRLGYLKIHSEKGRVIFG